MYSEPINWRKRINKITIILFFLIIFLGIIGIMFIPSVDAKVTFNSSLNVTEISDTTITWNFAYLTSNRPIGASLDGQMIEGFPTDFVYNFTANNLEPNTSHEFCLIGDATSNCETGKTTITETREDKINDFILEYILIVFIILLIIVGFRIPFGSIIAFVLSFIALLDTLVKGDFWLDVLFTVLCLSSMLVTYVGVKK